MGTVTAWGTFGAIAAAARLAAPATLATAATVRNRRRVVSTGVFVGGVLSTLSAWVIGFASFVARVRAEAEVPASPRLAFTLYVIMAKSITVKRKKAGRPATGTAPLDGVRISDELMAQIQKWARENSATRSEAIRRLVELGLKGKK